MSLALVINSGQTEHVGRTIANEKLEVLAGTAAGLDVSSAGALGLATGTPTATSVEIGTGGAGLPVTIGAGGSGGSLTTIAGDLSVSGDEVVVGTTTFQGNTQIGDNPADTLEVQASIINSTGTVPVANSSLIFQTGSDHIITVQDASAAAGNDLTVRAATGDAANAGGAATLVGGVGGGTDGAGGNAVVAGGAGGATNGDAGNALIDAGAPSGTGNRGVVAIGITNAGFITCGDSTIEPDFEVNGLIKGVRTSSAEGGVNLVEAIQINSDGTLTDVVSVLLIDGDPNGNVTTGAQGSLAIDAANAMLYQKTDDTSAWISFSTGSPSLDTVITVASVDNTVTIPDGNELDFSDGGVDLTNPLLSITRTGGGVNNTPALFINNSAAGAALDVQDGGTSVLTVDGAGKVTIAPTSAQNLQVDIAGGGLFDINATGSTLDYDGGNFLVDSTGLISLDATGGANLSTTGGTMVVANTGGTLSVTGSGNVTMTSSGGTVDIEADGAGASSFSVVTNSASAASLTISATNAGAGNATVNVGADETVDITSTAADLDLNAATGVTVDVSAGGISLDATAASNFTVSGATADLTLGARGSTITLNETGDTTLDAGFTATSIIGALNELFGGGGTVSNAGFTATTGENVAQGAPIAFSTSNTAVEGDANSGDTRENTIGLALAAATSGNPVEIVTAGEVTVPDAQWDSAPGAGDSGKIVYLSTTVGNLTLTPPVLGRVLKIGLVTFADASANTTRVGVQMPYSVAL